MTFHCILPYVFNTKIDIADVIKVIMSSKDLYDKFIELIDAYDGMIISGPYSGYCMNIRFYSDIIINCGNHVFHRRVTVFTSARCVKYHKIKIFGSIDIGNVEHFADEVPIRNDIVRIVMNNIVRGCFMYTSHHDIYLYKKLRV